MPTIRFCGGPWHNRLEDVELCPRLVVQCHMPQTTLSYAGCFKAASIKRDLYYLASYTSRFGTKYYQYVHESLVQGGSACDSTWRERFKEWRLNRRQMEARLRMAAKPTR